MKASMESLASTKAEQPLLRRRCSIVPRVGLIMLQRGQMHPCWTPDKSDNSELPEMVRMILGTKILMTLHTQLPKIFNHIGRPGKWVCVCADT